MPKQQITDPYAPPPLHKSKTGPLIRGVIIAGLLVVGGAIAYTVTQAPSQTAGLEQQQIADNRLADGSYAVSPQAAPHTEATAPEAATAPEPSSAPRVVSPRRSAAPRESSPPPADVAPLPETTTTPATPTPAQPLPPPDVSPSASGE